MGKMPPQLAKYWREHKKGKKEGSVKHMGKKSGKKGKSSRTTIPIMGALTAGSLAAGMLTTGVPSYGNLAPMTALKRSPVDAVHVGELALLNLTNPRAYVPVIVPAAIWIVGRALLGKKKITKRISIF